MLAVEYLSSTLGRILQLGFNISRGAGGFAVSPKLGLRRLLRKGSPVFDLFDVPAFWRLPIDQPAKCLDRASAQMLRHFRDGTASPYDVNEHGRNILHVG